MAFAHAHGRMNVEATLNDWFATNITAAGIPGWMPSARVVYDYPESPLLSGHSGHAFSITHMGAEPLATFEGRNTVGGSAGQMMQGMAEISCWVSKQAAGNAYQYRLRTLGDMVGRLLTSAREVELKNWYTSTAAPSGIGALVRVLEPTETTIANPDPANPDLHRRRFVVRYRWIERS